MSKLRTALILDHMQLVLWQKQALEYAEDLVEVKLILNCTNTFFKRDYRQHFLYYLLNIFCIRNEFTRKLPYLADNIPVIHFESSYEKNWQRIPKDVLEQLQKNNIDVVIKFGMGLLRDPDMIPVPYGVLSFHHGDPEQYRGRPAGFYELLHHAPRMGIIVQKLSNICDGGSIYARYYSKLTFHSYRKTMLNAYRNSITLLRKALYNTQHHYIESNSLQGKNYRLPSNSLVIKFIVLLLQRSLKRILYGLFVEKKWNISVQPKLLLQDAKAPSIHTLLPERVPTLDQRYRFYADPFISFDGQAIYAEAMNKRTGRGDIVQLHSNTGELNVILLQGKHYSYPQIISDGKRTYLLPEIASWSNPRIFRFSHNILIEQIALTNLENERLVDTTHFIHEGIHYLFASPVSQASDNLNLYYSHTLFGPYQAHPLNPIVVDPQCARMAGTIINEAGKLYRLGQNNCMRYGDGITVSEIITLSSEQYREQFIGKIAMAGLRGPHCYNEIQQLSVFDFYTEKFSIMAGFNRLKAYLL